jgi:hypothetical protein
LPVLHVKAHADVVVNPELTAGVVGQIHNGIATNAYVIRGILDQTGDSVQHVQLELMVLEVATRVKDVKQENILPVVLGHVRIVPMVQFLVQVPPPVQDVQQELINFKVATRVKDVQQENILPALLHHVRIVLLVKFLVPVRHRVRTVVQICIKARKARQVVFRVRQGPLRVKEVLCVPARVDIWTLQKENVNCATMDSI